MASIPGITQQLVSVDPRVSFEKPNNFKFSLVLFTRRSFIVDGSCNFGNFGKPGLP